MKHVSAVLVLAALFVGAGCGAPAATTTSTPATTAPPATAAPATTTTQSTTTTSAPATSTTLSEADLLSAFSAALDNVAPMVVDRLKGDLRTESVESLVFDTTTRTVVLKVASTYTAEGEKKSHNAFYHDQAWWITQNLSLIVWMDNVQELFGTYELPRFRLVLDELTYEVSGKTMVGVAKKQVDFEAWLAETKQ